MRRFLLRTLRILSGFILASIIFVDALRASPPTSQSGIGWYLQNGQAGTALLASSNDSPVASMPDPIFFERQLFALVNKARLDQNLPPLKTNAALNLSAQQQSQAMLLTSRFDPIDANGQTPRQRAERAGF